MDERLVAVPISQFVELVRENQQLKCEREMMELQHTIEDLRKQLDEVRRENTTMYFQLHPLREVTVE